jgi:hypothetical protein
MENCVRTSVNNVSGEMPDEHLSRTVQYTRVVQKVRGQLRFYQFNWVNIHIQYIKMFVVKFQIKIKCILIISKSLHEKIAILKTPSRCARPRVQMVKTL